MPLVRSRWAAERDLSVRMGVAGRAKLEAEFGLKTRATHYEEAYRGLLASTLGKAAGQTLEPDRESTSATRSGAERRSHVAGYLERGANLARPILCVE